MEYFAQAAHLNSMIEGIEAIERADATTRNVMGERRTQYLRAIQEYCAKEMAVALQALDEALRARTC